MKNAWNTISFLAVVHLLALLMFVGWLWQTDRLDRQRIEDLRALFGPTVPEARATAESAVLDTQLRRELAEDAALRRNPNRSSAEQIQVVSRTQAESRQSRRRIDDVSQQLLQQLDEATTVLEAERAVLAEDRKAWMQATDGDRPLAVQEQFTKAVKLLESLQPKNAKRKIVELVDSGKTEQAVAYLDAMNLRKAGKILAEFKTDEENKLATELLEKLRTFGVEAGAQSDSSDADAVASSG